MNGIGLAPVLAVGTAINVFCGTLYAFDRFFDAAFKLF